MIVFLIHLIETAWVCFIRPNIVSGYVNTRKSLGYLQVVYIWRALPLGASNIRGRLPLVPLAVAAWPPRMRPCAFAALSFLSRRERASEGASYSGDERPREGRASERGSTKT